jgi:hypothetical protein
MKPRHRVICPNCHAHFTIGRKRRRRRSSFTRPNPLSLSPLVSIPGSKEFKDRLSETIKSEIAEAGKAHLPADVIDLGRVETKD